MTRRDEWQPVVLLEESAATGFRGRGWYFRDPADRYALDGLEAVAGPYSTEAAARAEFAAYCEAMTV